MSNSKARAWAIANRPYLHSVFAKLQDPVKVEELRRALHALIGAPPYSEWTTGDVCLGLQMAADDVLEVMMRELEAAGVPVPAVPKGK